MLIILAGTIGRSGLGGQAWASMQYLAGFRDLGHDVFYVEDCGESSYAFDWDREEPTYDLDYPASFVGECLGIIGLGDRWIYRAGDDSRGMPVSALVDACSEAELLLMRATPMWTWRPEYDQPARRAFIDVDPGFTQFAIARGGGLTEPLTHCERFFTYGRNIGSADCPIPTAGKTWIPTVPPIDLRHWPVAHGPASHFSSLIRWTGFHEESYGDTKIGQRDAQFPKYIDLPRMTSKPLRMAAMGVDPEVLTSHGWDFVHGETVSRTPDAYQKFIRESRGEFLIPKHAYVATRSGWFSDRSVCYLASGRPVLVEDTGLDDLIPLGKGVSIFTDPASAVNALQSIDEDYDGHCTAARTLAEQFFSTEVVLPPLLESVLD